MIPVGPVTGVALASLATLVPVVRARSLSRRQHEAVAAAVPEAVDLLRLVVASGRSVHQVLGTVADRVPEPFAAPVAEVCRRVDMGARLGDALDVLDDLGEPVRPLVGALRSSVFDGVPLGPALDRVAADARVGRRRAAESRARRLPIVLLLPLVLCVLPAFGLLAVVPLVFVALQSLQF